MFFGEELLGTRTMSSAKFDQAPQPIRLRPKSMRHAIRARTNDVYPGNLMK